MIDDHLLLEVLGEALAPDPAEPGASELARLQADLASHRSPLLEGPLSDRPRSPARRRPVPRRLAWAGGAVAAVVIGLAAAGVRTDVLPGPLRTAAFDIGLPVSSPALVATRGDLSKLDAVLGTGRAASIRAVATKVRGDLQTLDPGERQGVVGTAEALLAEADLEAGAPQVGAAPSGSSDSEGAPGPAGSSTSGGTGADGAGGTGTGPAAATGPDPQDSSGNATAAGTPTTTTTTTASDNQDQSSTGGAQSNVQVSAGSSSPSSTTTTTTTPAAGDG